MNTQRSWTMEWSGVVGVLALLIMSFMARPALATARPSAPDVARIDAFIREQVQRHRIPGLALAVVEGDQIVYQAGYGLADGTGRDVTPQTPFVLASVSKPLTALAVMQLVEAERVALDAPVQRYLPDFQLADPVVAQQITVRHLLQHTSGIREPGCSSRAGARTLAQFVAELHTLTPVAPAGTHYEYCSGNYNVLGRIIEVVSGQSFGNYMQQQVFAPLGMHHSFASEVDARQHGLVQNYRWMFGLPVPHHDPFNPSQLPSGYLISSAEDLAHFVIAQLNGGRFGPRSVLSPDGIAATQAPGVPMGGGSTTYGLGWRTEQLGGGPAVLHTGDHADAHTLVFLQPERRRGAVLLFNAFSMLARATAFAEIEAGVAQLLAEQEPTPASSPSLPTLYLLGDAVLAGLLVLAGWPLLRLRRWEQRLRQHHPLGRWHRLRIGLRLAWELGMPVALLLGARLFVGSMFGAQSWQEILLVFPDVGAWLWTLALLVLLTGATRLVRTLRILRPTEDDHRRSAPATATSGRPT